MCTVTKESLVSTCVWECANTSETHASRFGVPNRHRYRLTVGHRPRSAVVRHRCRKGITRERRVNRYYDPSTDQFLSVDPDVAETGQPYAFTGDDPLNETDPLGLISQGNVNYLLSTNKHRKFCAAHPGITGHSCGGLLHAIAGSLDKARHFVAVHRTGELQILGAVAAVTAIVATGGAAALAETAAGSVLDTTATVSSFVAGAADAPGCASDSGTAQVTSCIGAVSGGLGGIGGLATTGVESLSQLKVVFGVNAGLLSGFGDWATAVNGSNSDQNYDGG